MALSQDVVYLKNGSIIKGSVVELIPNSSIKIQTQDGSLFVYDMSEVEHVMKEDGMNDSNTKYALKPGIRRIAELGADLGYDYIFNASFMLGRQINPYFFIGGGVSPSFNYEFSFILPVYCALRVDFINNNKSPFIDTRVGCFVGVNSGFYGYLGTGYRMNHLSLSTGVSCHKNCYDYKHDDDYYPFLCFRVGYEF